jgi:hypothetical protein
LTTLTKAKANAKHIYSTGVTYDRQLQLAKYFNLQATADITIKATAASIPSDILILYKIYFSKFVVM